MKDIDKIIQNRHSTRSFAPDFSIRREDQRYLLEAGCRAPSPKNRQPWEFVVLTDRESIRRAAVILKSRLEVLKEERREKKLADSDIDMAFSSAEILQNVSMLIFVCYQRDARNGHNDALDWPLNALGFEVADLQAIGACIENMLLAAEERGIASLWLCDVLYAHEELSAAFSMRSPFVAAVAFGKEATHQTTRISVEQKTIWFDGNV